MFWLLSYEDCVNNYYLIVICVDDYVDCESFNIIYVVCFFERMGYFFK